MEDNLKKEKYNICRPIILFNNFLPTSKEKNKWEYMAFGAFDGISIGKAIVSSSSGEILKELWKHQKNYSKGLQGKAAVQIIYALCHEDKNEESSFWQGEENPFTFFCRLQFRGNIGLLRKNKVKIEDIIKNGCDALVKIYTMYDNSDLLIVIRTKKYGEGVKILNSLHQNVNFALDEKEVCELKNSFTIFALKQKYVNKTSEEKFAEYLNEEIIEKAYVNIVKRKCSKRADWKELINSNLKKKLKSAIEGVFVLGTDDEVVFFRNIGWGDFLKLYRDYIGIFNNTSDEYQEFIASTATVVCADLKQYFEIWSEWEIQEVGKHDNSKLNSGKSGNTLYKDYIDKLRKKVDELSEKNQENDIYKELYVILNILPKFTEEVFSDYVFFVILRPLSTLLELLEEGFNDSYYEFIKAFNLSIQNSVKSDKHAMQIMDFNTKLYDIPTKLNAFYTAYVYNVSDILNIKGENSEPHLYDFIVVPGVTNFVNVVELFQRVSEDKRLLRIEIPENRFYDIDNIMIIFAHEAAHYVGTAIRKRKERYEYILYSIANIYIDYITSYMDDISDICPGMNKVNWQLITQRCKNVLHKMLERELNEQYLRRYSIGISDIQEQEVVEYTKYNTKYKEHFSFIEKYAFRAMSDIVEYMLPNIFGGIVFDLPEEQKHEVYQVIKEISTRFLGNHGRKTTMITLETALEQLNHLYEECFADIIAITLLDLDSKEYLNSIIEENRLQSSSIEELSKTEVIYRIGIVLNVMGTQMEAKKLNFYAEDNFLEGRLLILEAASTVLQCIDEGWQNILEEEEYRNCSFFALLNRNIYDMAFKYLVECREEFVKQINKDKDRSGKCKKLRDFFSRYKTSEESNIEEQVAEIEEIIEVYKNRLSEELKKYLTR